MFQKLQLVADSYRVAHYHVEVLGFGHVRVGVTLELILDNGRHILQSQAILASFFASFCIITFRPPHAHVTRFSLERVEYSYRAKPRAFSPLSFLL